MQTKKCKDKMHQNKNQNKNKHVPVLLSEVLSYLSPEPGENYLDLTAGYGGHALVIADKIGSLRRSVLVDRDENAVRELKKLFPADTTTILHTDFLSASKELKSRGRQFDLILADLGVSSPHLNDGIRGFSINNSGPLDMRMDQSQDLTASKIVNSYSEAELVNILKRYGEEPRARSVARAIIRARPVKTTDQLAAAAASVWRKRGKMHPATRTFQAVRIAVNDELGLLEKSLPLWLELLTPGGRIAIISFHSLEDRLVKKTLKQASGNRFDAELTLLTKKPVSASPEEIVHNPRARSAKLRAAAKIKRKGN